MTTTPMPGGYNYYKRGQNTAPTPAQLQSRAFQSSQQASNMAVNTNEFGADPIKEYDYELQSQNLENRANDIRVKLMHQHWQDTLDDVHNRQQQTYNQQQQQWNSLSKPPPMFRSFKNPSLEFMAFAKAVSGQESGGKYDIVNQDSGALGRYQVMPENIAGAGGWDQDILGRNISTQRYLNSPRLQDKIALGELQKMYRANGLQGAASQWYSGDPNAYRDRGSQGNYPSIHAYVQSVQQRYNKILPKLEARQAAFSHLMGQSTGLRHLGDPTKGAGNWAFGSEGDWGHRTTGQGFHTGIDFDIPIGTPIYASQSGKIGRANWDDGYGNQIFVNGDHRTQTRYQHLSRFVKGLSKGDFVKKGQLIGYSGDTGSYSEGAHLHFETLRRFKDTSRFDPRRIEQGWTSVNPWRFFRRFNPHDE